MCGIAGIITSEPGTNAELTRETLTAMQTALAHRGPDGKGHYTSKSGMASLCHTRLSIIDLSKSGHQPMVIDGQIAITFNGEIYNHQALRIELEDQGVQFSSDSDTEVILRLYEKYGEQCVTYLRGMFAFFIWDERSQSGFAARDPLGIKPFYYTHKNDHSFAFSSEVRSLLKANFHTNELSQDGLKSYFLTGTIAEPNTLLTDVFMLPAGHTLRWTSNTLKKTPYWSLSFKPQQMSQSQAITLTRNALESTVKAHFVSDVPVGIFLSGGIDSTALVALACKITGARLNTYSIAFESPQWNEGHIAKRVAEHFGTHHTEFLITAELAKPLFAEFIAAVDQPTIDGFNTFCVSKFARDSGEKVVLSGVGGDELFAGYQSFSTIPTMMRWGRSLRTASKLFDLISHSLGKKLPSKALRILDYLKQPESLAKAHQSFRGIFSQQESHALTSLIGSRSSHYNQTREAHSPDSPIIHTPMSAPTQADQISQLELQTYMRNQLLRDSDVMSMACGLELRVPFVDKELIDTISKVPATYRLDLGKQLLIKAVPEIPVWVSNRPKQGFRFPFDEWFNHEWHQLIKTQPATPHWIKLRPWYRRWSITVLEHWLTRYVQPPQTKPDTQ